MAGNLKGMKVLVVGASAGIGRHVASVAADSGAQIAVASRRREPLEELVAAAGGGTIITADLSKPEDCARIAAEAGAALGTIDLVVFAAGTAKIRPLRKLTAEEWALTLGTNLVGINLTIAALLPHMAEGAVLGVMSSEAAGRPHYGLGHYAASKSAVEDTMRAWRIEHPAVRFTTLVIGSTEGTEFANNFELEEMQEAFPIWAAQGNFPSWHMKAEEVATVCVEMLATLLPHRTVGVDELVLRSPAPLVGTEDSVASALDAAAQRDDG
jgi:NAD(P)-dependent dehydrogenase (short-subunit alcohol dehydrogenase family)